MASHLDTGRGVGVAPCQSFLSWSDDQSKKILFQGGSQGRILPENKMHLLGQWIGNALVRIQNWFCTLVNFYLILLDVK